MTLDKTFQNLLPIVYYEHGQHYVCSACTQTSKPLDFYGRNMMLIEDYGSEKVITKLFDIAIECEYGATKLYKKFALLFSHVPEVSSFWKDLQNDEIEHARKLQHSRSTLSSKQLMESPSEKIWNNSVMVHKKIKALSSTPVSNLNDAYEMAHELEYDEINSVFIFLSFENNNNLGDSKINPHIEIIKHREKISQFSKRYGDKSWRTRVQAQDNIITTNHTSPEQP